MKVHSVFFASAALMMVACSGGSDSKGGTSTAKTQSGTDPAKDSSGSSSNESSLGPSCEAFVACCEDAVAAHPEAKASCDSVRKSIEDAQAKGVSTETYESSCKSATQQLKTMKYCD